MSVTVTPSTTTRDVAVTVSNARGPAGADGANSITSATTSDGTADLSLLNATTATAEVTGTLTASHIHGNLAGSVYEHVRAGENLAKGDPVYVSGSHGSGSTLIAEVSKADASNAAKMPAVGVMDADVANNASGHMVIIGTITELDTSAYSVNAELYVASGGGFTATPPTIAQPVARVERANANNGAVIVKVGDLSASDGTSSSLVRRSVDGGANFEGVVTAFSFATTTGASFDVNGLYFPSFGFDGFLIVGENTADRTATLPDATGTIALTSSIDGQPDKLSDGTISGATTVSEGTTWTYGTGAASAHRTALGLGATGSIAASDPLTVTQTWTNAATTYTGLQVNVTDSGPSNAASLLMDLRVGGVSRLSVNKLGLIALPPGGGDGTGVVFGGSSITNARSYLGQYGLRLTQNLGINWSASTNLNALELSLYRDAANTLAQRNGTNAQAFRLYNTYTSSTNFERLNFRWDTNVAFIGTEKGSASPGGTARDLVLETDGTERVRVSAAGAVTVSGTMTATNGFNLTGGNITLPNGSNQILWSARARLSSPADGLLLLRNSASSGFDRLQLGGTTSSFPAIKRTDSDIEIVKADGTAVDTAIILASPDGTRYRVTVANGGALTTTAL